MKNSILLVEDDHGLAESIADYLLSEGFDVEIESNGAVAEKRILAEHPDLVILDLNLPGKDGISVCTQVRASYPGHILMFTAKEEEIDQIIGLEVGADDYLVKPVRPRLLLARVRALLRRRTSTNLATQVKQFGKLTIDPTARHVTLGEEAIALTSMEFDLLNLLSDHAAKVITRDSITRELMGREYDGLARGADTAVSGLRRKLGDNSREPQRIKTVRGKGYMFVPTTWS